MSRAACGVIGVGAGAAVTPWHICDSDRPAASSMALAAMVVSVSRWFPYEMPDMFPNNRRAWRKKSLPVAGQSCTLVKLEWQTVAKCTSNNSAWTRKKKNLGRSSFFIGIQYVRLGSAAKRYYTSQGTGSPCSSRDQESKVAENSRRRTQRPCTLYIVFIHRMCCSCS